MGTVQQKRKLGGDLLGVDAKTVNEIFNKDRNTLPCVYLFTLGYVKDLRKSMNIDIKYRDESIVCKFGFTKDLGRRTAEHINKFNKIENVDLKLKYYSYIDPQYISEAENNIKLTMKGLNIYLDYEKEEELVVISKEFEQIVDDTYTLIGKKYMGHIAELITQMKNKDNEMHMNNMKHEMEVDKLNHTIDTLKHINELQKEKYEHEILKRDFELLKLKSK
jgi:hypothetical protein